MRRIDINIILLSFWTVGVIQGKLDLGYVGILPSFIVGIVAAITSHYIYNKIKS